MQRMIAGVACAPRRFTLISWHTDPQSQLITVPTRLSLRATGTLATEAATHAGTAYNHSSQTSPNFGENAGFWRPVKFAFTTLRKARHSVGLRTSARNIAVGTFYWRRPVFTTHHHIDIYIELRTS
jgi:hypothetical protein